LTSIEALTFDTENCASYASGMKISLTPHQEKFIAAKMKTGGYLSQDEVVREALRVYELVEQEDYDPELEEALRHSLRGPLKKYRLGHFATLSKPNGRRTSVK
jgi:putative addiction module CopG family antidote